MSIVKAVFGTLSDGRKADLYTLKNNAGMSVVVTNYGCKLQKVLVPNKNGDAVDVILGHDTLAEYEGRCFQGSLVGRYANRIGGGVVDIEGKTYELEKNDGKNALHSGTNGLHQVLWDVAETVDSDTPSITFTHFSPDGDMGLPGNIEFKVVYSLSADNALTLDYFATSDAITPVNLTNHSYFNLSGDHSQKVLDTYLQINADYITKVGPNLIPTGELLPVKGTGLDFTQSKKIGQDIASTEELIAMCHGYDHNFCIRGTGLREHAKAWCPQSGIVMTASSDLPGMQLYTFNGTPPKAGKNGVPFHAYAAFCLETQFYPDAVHHANFPFQMLTPNVPFETKTVYQFSIQ